MEEREIKPTIFSSNYCSVCAFEANTVLNDAIFDIVQPVAIIAGPLTSEDYTKINKMIHSIKPSPKIISIGHCALGEGLWPIYSSMFLNDIPRRFNLQTFIRGCPPHPTQIKEILSMVIKK